MASEFQRHKIAGVHHAMDADNNGYLEESDFEALAQRWAGNRGHAKDTEEAGKLRSIMKGWWTTLASASSGARDRIDLEDADRGRPAA